MWRIHFSPTRHAKYFDVLWLKAQARKTLVVAEWKHFVLLQEGESTLG